VYRHFVKNVTSSKRHQDKKTFWKKYCVSKSAASHFRHDHFHHLNAYQGKAGTKACLCHEGPKGMATIQNRKNPHGCLQTLWGLIKDVITPTHPSAPIHQFLEWYDEGTEGPSFGPRFTLKNSKKSFYPDVVLTK
jgi:hypothetical protein